MVTAGKLHFLEASYLEPLGSFNTRCVLASMPFFALALRTKNSWTLKVVFKEKQTVIHTISQQPDNEVSNTTVLSEF